MRPYLLIAPLLLAGSASAQARAPPPAERSRDEVLALPTVEAARALLGDIASRFVELTDCRDPRAEFGALDLRNLAFIEVLQPDRDQPDFLVHASFYVEPGRSFSFGWQVSLEFNGEPLPVERQRRASFFYGRTRLYRY